MHRILIDYRTHNGLLKLTLETTQAEPPHHQHIPTSSIVITQHDAHDAH